MSRRSWRTFALVAAGAALATPSAVAFDVEPDSLGNRLYVVVWNRDSSASLEAVQVSVGAASFTTTPTPVSVPTSVPPDEGRLAGFDFDVLPSASIGQNDSLSISITGTLQGVARAVDDAVALDVVATASSQQGLVGAQTGVPGIEGLDTDGDGTPDQEEIAAGTDPFDPDSFPPPGPAPVPALSRPTLLLLAGVLLFTGLRLFRTRDVECAG